MFVVPVISSAATIVLLAFTAGGRIFPKAVARSVAALDRWRCGLVLKHCEVMGFQMPYLEGGAGEPLILIHGLGGQKENFTRLAAYLCKRCHLFIPDLPGFGAASRNPEADYHIAAQAGRVMAFADAMGLRRVHLGGNSMGGFIAAECAGRYPDRVASLWLIAAAGASGTQETLIMREFESTGVWPLLIHQPSDFEQLLHTWMEHPPGMPYAVKLVLGRRGAADCELHRHIALQALGGSPPLAARFKHLATPTLIMWGAQDRVLHPSCATSLQNLFVDSKVRLLPSCGHVPMMEAPRQSANEYMAFRARLGRRTMDIPGVVQAHGT
jgi:pimeloyl-ACP methyl ester carboxylesterase